jgi:phospholipase/carboxylesterase
MVLKKLSQIIFLSSFILYNAMNTNAQALKYLIAEPKIKTQKPPVIFLLHGAGSNENDLFSFANQLPKTFVVVSLQAPITLGNDRFLWFQVTFSAEGKPIPNLEQLSKSEAQVLEIIEEVKSKYQFDDEQIYLCGFSQGASISYNIGLLNPEKFKGIAILSGRIFDAIKPTIKPSERLKHLNFFIAHGTNDQAITIDYARNSVDFLEQLGINPTYIQNDGGHTISNETITEMLVWLRK